MEYGISVGIFSEKGKNKRIGIRYNSVVIDLLELYKINLFNDLPLKKSTIQNEFLNEFISLGKPITQTVFERCKAFFKKNYEPKSTNTTFFKNETEVTLSLPIKIGNYTDFYSSEQHAYNVGCMFRDPQNALMPNWKHLPVAYHGRASSIFVSGKNFHRPKGQLNSSDTTQPIFSPTKRLDIELEMATIIGKGNEIGHPISVNEAESHIFGFSLFNDWSARDIQRWEYVPLGPFLAKNFFSSLGAWVVPIEELTPFKIDLEKQNPPVLPYLKENKRQHFDVTLEVYLQPNNSNEPQKISTSNFSNLYWTVGQQIAHHTISGCNLEIGDVLASGTISGKEPTSFGSLLELTWGGKNPIQFINGVNRTFLEDGDTIILKGFAEKSNYRVDFGEVRTTILPAL